MGFSRLTVTLSAYILVCLCSRSLPGESGPLKVDLDRGEIRVPCRFVNPTRVLEVFACHRRGPGHETVLLFDATGPQLVEALTEIGCRGSNFWNVTGPEDFEKTQGDRVLVSVSWIWKGERVEIPAEGILTDGDFGFPAFHRRRRLSRSRLAGPIDKRRFIRSSGIRRPRLQCFRGLWSL